MLDYIDGQERRLGGGGRGEKKGKKIKRIPVKKKNNEIRDKGKEKRTAIIY